VNGVDAAFIGPFDLSGSMGIPGQLEHPAMRAALRKFLRVCRQHRMTAGYHVVRPEPAGVRRAVAAGYTLIALGVDTVFLQQEAARALALVKAAKR
jgi:2-dehydro-3-deoxyglucarate aldolase